MPIAGDLAFSRKASGTAITEISLVRIVRAAMGAIAF